MKTIKMFSRADKVQGQGVLSAFSEQVSLVKEGLSDKYIVKVNGFANGDITHFHTINFRYFLRVPFSSIKGVTVGYVHFLPETIEGSIKLPKVIKKIFYWYIIAFYKSMDRLVTVNPCFIDKLQAYGIDESKITYIPNYVDNKYFYEMPDVEKKSIREKYGIPEDKFVVLGVGQVQTRKGIEDFIKTASLMPEKLFLWAGGFSFGIVSDGFEKLKKEIDVAPPNVKFLGIIRREDMNELYNIADLMFLPSFNELFPMSILEATCCGLPILLRDIDVYKPILLDTYMKGSSPDEFAEAVENISTSEEIKKLWKNKSKEVQLLYYKENVLKKWEMFYDFAYEQFKSKKMRRSGRQKDYEKYTV